MLLKNKTVLITGATSGIGKATAHRFVAEGARVTLVGLNEDEGQEAERELRDAGGEARFARADVARAEDVRRAVAETMERWGRVDVLVNNAAVMTFDRVLDLSETDWDWVFAVNLRGPFLFARECLSHMGEGCAIINVSSVHAQATGPGVAPYAASKGGLEAFTRALATECDAQKIRVNAVRLGAIDTPMLRSNPHVRSGEEKLVPLELGRPEEAAAAIVFLASDEASFITGAVLDVDGGRLSHLGSHGA